MAKILVIDDDPDFIEATRMALEANDFEVDAASTSQEGIEKVLGGSPDLVILDVIMDKLPIIMLSNIHSEKKVPYRFDPDKEYLPVDVFLDKPIKPDLLIRTIQEILGELREEPKHPL
jgi:CheY-like chemotaxis protein